MKNNFLKFFLIFLFLNNLSFAEQFRFETTEVQVTENGNLIKATNGKAFSGDEDLEIQATNFEYSKNLDLLKAYNGVAYIKSENLEIDKKKNTIIAKDEVKVNELQKKLSVETESVFYDRNINILKSNSTSTFNDRFGNLFVTKKFEYNINEDILKIKNANFKDFNNNSFNIDLAYINTTTNKMVGKDIFVNLNNETFNEDNEPRLKGNSVIYDNENMEITKGVFTTCKKNDDCPPWQLSAEKIQHDKKNKIIKYKNAWLKIYDVPVVYFPTFFHPDPTVKRQSGFLIPTIQSSTKNNYLNIPYYHVLSDNKDITFIPRLYADDKILLQSEYRQANLNSNHISDISFFKEKDTSSKSHLFYEFNKKMNFLNFQDSNVDLKVQQTSNDTYLRANKLKSPIIDSMEFLQSSLNLDLYSEDFSVKSELTVYEDLDKNHSDRYEFILPRINFSKKIENKTKLNGNFLFNSDNLVRNYETNIFEKTNINDLVFNSNPEITSNGFYNNYDFIIKNVNSDTQNSSLYKEDGNNYLSGLVQFNSSLPLIKESNGYRNILKPKFALKISPDNTKDMKDDEVRIDVDSIYNLNRISTNDTIEGGASLTYGSDFTIFDGSDSREVFGLKIANNLRLEENKDLPANHQINQKTSDFFGEIAYSPNEILTTKYNTSVKNNLNEVTYENFSSKIKINNFVTTFEYINENNTSESNSYVVNDTSYSFDNKNNLSFSTRENKKTNLTEYYNFIYQYKIDCLAASIEYNKDYYNDRDIRPEENIFFKLTIIPFGEASSPNLKQ